MATPESNAAQIAAINTWINSVITNSKLPAELAAQTDITDVNEVSILQKGTDEAKGVATALLRGYKGTWNASTNTPTLIDGTGIDLDNYYVSVAGSQDLGSGSIAFKVGDMVKYANGFWSIEGGTGFLLLAGGTMTGDINFDDNDIVDVKGIGFKDGEQMTWNPDDFTVNIPTGLGAVLQVGQEILIPVLNQTGFQIDNGTVCRPIGSVGGVITIDKAIADSHTTITGQLFVVTTDIPDGDKGMVTRFGKVRGLDTTIYIPGALWLSPTVAGEITSTKPEFPDYPILIGGVSEFHATEGVIFVDVKGDPSDTFNNFYNGTIRETFEFLVNSDGAIITGSLSPSNGHPDLTMLFSDGFFTLDTSPAATITLTEGTDTVPQPNYVYILESTKVLTLSITGFPTTEHIKIAYMLLPSASTTQTDKALINQNLNDHVQDTTTNQGHLSHITRRLRLVGAQWISGCEGNSVVNDTPTPDSVSLVATGGVVAQLHDHIFNAFDTAVSGHAHVVNHSTTPYKEISDLHDLVTDGEVISNTSFSIVMWGVVNSMNEPSKLMINLPSDSYSFASPDDAVNDALNFSDYSIPAEFSTVAFLIARITYTYKNNDWVVYDNEDLRGKIPNSTAGGGGSGGTGVTTYLGLTDTPNTYAGSELFLERVNAGGTQTEHVDGETLFVTLDTEQTITAHKTLNDNVKIKFGSSPALWDFYSDGTDLLLFASPSATGDIKFQNGPTNIVIFGRTTGNITSIGTITGSTIVKNGATSDDILLGDGSTTPLSGISGAEPQGFAFGDETTDMALATSAVTITMPNFATTLTGVSVNVVTAPTGSTAIFDINEGGVSILSTKISIDAGEFTSETAATPPVISDSSIAANAIITVDIDQIGSIITGAGGKVWIYYTRA